MWIAIYILTQMTIKKPAARYEINLIHKDECEDELADICSKEERHKYKCVT